MNLATWIRLFASAFALVVVLTPAAASANVLQEKHVEQMVQQRLDKQSFANTRGHRPVLVDMAGLRVAVKSCKWDKKKFNYFCRGFVPQTKGAARLAIGRYTVDRGDKVATRGSVVPVPRSFVYPRQGIRTPWPAKRYVASQILGDAARGLWLVAASAPISASCTHIPDRAVYYLYRCKLRTWEGVYEALPTLEASGARAGDIHTYAWAFPAGQ